MIAYHQTIAVYACHSPIARNSVEWSAYVKAILRFGISEYLCGDGLTGSSAVWQYLRIARLYGFHICAYGQSFEIAQDDPLRDIFSAYAAFV
jgi:hypothetical protein